MSAPVFRSSGIDPRRLNQPAHQIARQTHGERLRIHGPIRPMKAPARPEPVEGRIHGDIRPMADAGELPSWATIGKVAAVAIAIVALTWTVIPGLAWLTLKIGKAL